jgi:hypothetical protein
MARIRNLSRLGLFPTAAFSIFAHKNVTWNEAMLIDCRHKKFSVLICGDYFAASVDARGRSHIQSVGPARLEEIFAFRSRYPRITNDVRGLPIEAHCGRPTRCNRSWNRASDRKGSKPGRSRMDGLNCAL